MGGGDACQEDVRNSSSASFHIKWITCAQRFTSSWRFSQEAKGPLAPSPLPSPPPMSPRTPPSSPWEALTSFADRAVTEDYGVSGDVQPGRQGRLLRGSQERGLSIIGFVHSPQSTFDGVMVTITYSKRGERQGRPWGFVSDVRKGHGFACRDDAMRAAERAFFTASESWL